MGKIYFKVTIKSKNPQSDRQIVIVCRQNEQSALSIEVVEGESLVYFANDVSPETADDMVRYYRKHIDDDDC